jgi:hypothetical protein
MSNTEIHEPVVGPFRVDATYAEIGMTVYRWPSGEIAGIESRTPRDDEEALAQRRAMHDAFHDHPPWGRSPAIPPSA